MRPVIRSRVTVEEIDALTADFERLVRLGDRASESERDKLTERRIDMLRRVASDPVLGVDAEGKKLQSSAREEAAELEGLLRGEQ